MTSESHKELAIVLVSGGMDSCVTAAIAHQKYEMAFLHVGYGQRTQSRELEAFNAIAHHYDVKKRLAADIGYLRDIGGSSLTDDSIPVAVSSMESGHAIPASYVPFRNTHLNGSSRTCHFTVPALQALTHARHHRFFLSFQYSHFEKF